MEEDYCPEDHAYFIDCDCEHDDEAHDWDSCNVEDCECEGHWEY